ncbi:MAG: hypothetical protein AB1711_12665 [Thermodesulfobacteriota bacterium]
MEDESMEFVFNDIPEGFFKARVSRIKRENGIFGQYLRITFLIIEEGQLNHYQFSGTVKPTLLKQSKFYRWISNILGYSPDHKISTQQIIGRECFVYVARQNNHYCVIDVSTNPDGVSPPF